MNEYTTKIIIIVIIIIIIIIITPFQHVCIYHVSHIILQKKAFEHSQI